MFEEAVSSGWPRVAISVRRRHLRVRRRPSFIGRRTGSRGYRCFGYECSPEWSGRRCGCECAAGL